MHPIIGLVGILHGNALAMETLQNLNFEHPIIRRGHVG